MSLRSRTPDEETPLLRGDSEEGPKKPQKVVSPIPWGQFTILLVLQLSEPLTSQVIHPFAPQLIRDLGVTHGDETKVGYYVGILQSLFFATQALTVLHWSRASDHLGRKPIIMTGLFGISLSMYSFGLSKTFPGAVISRSLNGALNGNIGVLKSQFGALFDETNMAIAYAYLPMAWSTGSTIGPLIGGGLSWPTKQFPNVFGHSAFLAKYPYFLPCAVPATFAALACIVTFFLLDETVRQPVPLAVFLKLRKAPGNLALQNVVGAVDPAATEDPVPEESSGVHTPTSATTRVGSSAASAVKVPDEDDQPYPLRKLLTREVIVAGGNYALLSLVDIAFRGIQPLFFSTPRSLGGLELPPPKIGLILAVYGVMNGLFQIFLFARINERFGTKNTFTAGIISTVFMFASFPLISILADARGGVDNVVYAAVGVQLVAAMMTSLSYGCIFIFITAASPNRASLGGTNGLCQMLVSWMRAFGPGLANSLYSVSLRQKSWTVYYVMEVLSIIAITGACMLPRSPWRK